MDATAAADAVSAPANNSRVVPPPSPVSEAGGNNTATGKSVEASSSSPPRPPSRPRPGGPAPPGPGGLNWGRKNTELSREDKLEKRLLKKELKFRRRKRGIETRMRHARVRGDPVVEREAAAALERLLGEHARRRALHHPGGGGGGAPRVDGDATGADGGVGAHDAERRRGSTTNSAATPDVVSNGGSAPGCAAPEGKVGVVGSDVGTGRSGRREGTRQFVMSICHRLFYDGSSSSQPASSSRRGDDYDEHDTSVRKGKETNSNKLEDHERATRLLRHMTKGTQTLSMFDGEDGASALRGYSRRKFLERAMLVCDSLLRLDDDGGGNGEDGDGGDSGVDRSMAGGEPAALATTSKCKCAGGATSGLGDDEVAGEVSPGPASTADPRGSGGGGGVGGGGSHPSEPPSSSSVSPLVPSDAWAAISGARRACSIGCGPGNDMVGLVGLLLQIRQSAAETNAADLSPPVLEEATLLDWAIGDWAKAVLDPLTHLLVPRYVRRASTGFCDVTLPLSDPRNAAARRCLCRNGDGDEGFDLFLISYLLLETRGRWEGFVLELMSEARSGTAFYFAEPTPWQLHRLMEVVGGGGIGGGSVASTSAAGGAAAELHPGRVDFMWVDSSMHLPALQALDGRVGPAVLFARKRWRLCKVELNAYQYVKQKIRLLMIQWHANDMVYARLRCL